MEEELFTLPFDTFPLTISISISSDDVNARQISKALSHKICFERKGWGKGKKKRESKKESLKKKSSLKSFQD